MEVIKIEGIRKNSTFFYVPIQKKIFLLREKKNDTIYVKCYNIKCKSRGKIVNDLFFYTSEAHTHDNSVSDDETLAYVEFMNELRQKITKGDPYKCFNEIKSK